MFTVAELAAEPAALGDYMARRGPAAGLARRWVLPLAVPATFTPPAQADRAAVFDQRKYDASSSLQITPSSALTL